MSDPILFRSFNDRRVFVALSTASLVLWILTIADTSFYYFPPDPLYFFSSLPFTYWIGISILIALIVSGLYRDNEFLIIIFVFLYVNGISAFVFETPRYSDVYLHSSGSESILVYGTTNTQQVYHDFPQDYSKQFPSAFIFLAILKLITGADTFLLLKVIQFIGFFIMVMFVYLTTRNINRTYAFFGTIIFISLSLSSTHFSPATFGFIYYSFIIYCLVLIVSGKINNSRKILTILFASLLIFPTINPTADQFILAILIGLLLSSLLLSKHLSLNVSYNKIAYLSFFALVIIIGWVVYNEEFSISGPSDRVEQISKGLGKSVLPPKPTQNYLIYSFVSYTVVINSSLLAFTILIIIIILIRYKYINTKNFNTNLFILSSILLLSPLLSIPFVLGLGDLGFIRRPYVFVLFALPAFLPLSYDIGLFAAKYKRLLLVLNKTMIIFALSALLLIPITRYGLEPPTYVPYSSLYATSLLSNEDDISVVTIGAKHLMHYYSSLYDIPTSSKQIKLEKYVNGTDLTYTYNQLSTEIGKSLNLHYLNGYAIISKPGSNSMSARYQTYDYTDYINNNLVQGENLIVDTYLFRIYKNFE